jgi:serine/threonine protein kinase
VDKDGLNKNDESKPKASDSDFDQTIREHAKSALPPKKKDTTQPAKSDITGLPLSDAIIDKELGTGKIIGKIGSGGMGDVYKIWNEDLGLFRAVKILQRCDNQQLARRFEREIKISAQFDHPNIVRIHATGTWKGYRYLEMEFIDGASLDSWIQKSGKIPPYVCVAIGILIARALHYAHNHAYTLEGKVCKGIIHRDIKPANIMLAKDGKLKIMDFGIARPVGEEIATLTMGIVGSWPYLPPEQIDGCSVDHRADLYAVGAVLYEIIAGHVAFPCESQKALILSKTRGHYKPLTERVAGLPQGLVKIIDKCLKVNPGSRYQSAEELEQDLLDLHKTLSALPAEKVLESFTRGEAAPPLAIPHRKTKIALIRKPWEKKTALGATAAAILLCIAIAIYFMSEHQDQVLETPRIFEPKETVKVDPLKTFVKWHAVSNAQSYSVLLSSSDNFSDTIFNKQLTDTICPMATLQESRTYYFQVIARNSRATAVSNPLCFTTGALPPRAPVQVYPGNADHDVPTRPVLKWLHDASSSFDRVQISLTPDFALPVCDSIGISDTAFTPAELQEATLYFWRVMRTIDGKNSPWSDQWSFNTKKDSIAKNSERFLDLNEQTPKSILAKIPSNDTIRTRSPYGTSDKQTSLQVSPIQNVPFPLTEKLQNYYGNSDMGKIAEKAMQQGKLGDADSAIRRIDIANILKIGLQVRLSDQYISQGNFKRARYLLSLIQCEDALFHICKGRILMKDGEFEKASSEFEIAAFSNIELADKRQAKLDIQYFQSECREMIYRRNPTPENRAKALRSWKKVQQLYAQKPNDPRYILATHRLGSF